jgi:hypothetical protein
VWSLCLLLAFAAAVVATAGAAGSEQALNKETQSNCRCITDMLIFNLMLCSTVCYKHHCSQLVLCAVCAPPSSTGARNNQITDETLITQRGSMHIKRSQLRRLLQLAAAIAGRWQPAAAVATAAAARPLDRGSAAATQQIGTRIVMCTGEQHSNIHCLIEFAASKLPQSGLQRHDAQQAQCK